MEVSRACIRILDQLTGVVTQIKDIDFTKPVDALGNATIGQHVRHTLEFFMCYEMGLESGVVNYDMRGHDQVMEQDRALVMATIDHIKRFVSLPEEKPLLLQVAYDQHPEAFISIATNTLRELVYNIEHAVHHMAIMKIGIREAAPYVQLPQDFGLASSTIRYRATAVARHLQVESAHEFPGENLAK